MTSLSLVLLLAVAHALVCHAAPAYEILEADDEEGLSEAMKWEGPEAKEAVQVQEEEEVEKRSRELKADGEELEAGMVEGALAPARGRRGILCIRVCIGRICRASPAYEILEADDEEGLSEGLKLEGPEEQEAMQEQAEEEDEKRSSELKADAEELEAGSSPSAFNSLDLFSTSSLLVLLHRLLRFWSFPFQSFTQTLLVIGFQNLVGR
nr:unnamed protein product [Spirometra erinaceieuropaei]